VHSIIFTEDIFKFNVNLEKDVLVLILYLLSIILIKITSSGEINISLLSLTVRY
jgi:hypothetical protein